MFLIASHALSGNHKICWWVAPTYDPSKVAFRRCVDFLAENKIPCHVNKSELRIEFDNRSTITFKSADREDGLRGETVDFMVIDEMGLLKRDAWEYALRGTITATGASVVFIGTPKGKNLFYELFMRGQLEDPHYASFQIESRESPYFPAAEWAEVERLPQRIFEQEYQAKFIDDGGEVFRNVRGCVKGELEKKKSSSKSYFAGVDLAKSYDYTVVCVLDENGHVCAWDRFNEIAWGVQKARVTTVCNKYDAYALLDSTGLGDPILDDLAPHMRVEGYKFTNISKRQLIENLAICIEREEISFPDIPELINELNTYAFEQTDGGLIKYNAPSGLHDDCVVALALAVWAWNRGRGGTDAVTSEDGRITAESW